MEIYDFMVQKKKNKRKNKKYLGRSCSYYHYLKIIRSKEYFLVFDVVRPLVLILPSFY